LQHCKACAMLSRKCQTSTHEVPPFSGQVGEHFPGPLTFCDSGQSIWRQIMRNPLSVMRLRSNLSPNALSRETSETHNVYGKNIRIDAKTHSPRNHWGWDLLAADDTPVYAVASGIVTSAWHDPSFQNYGNQIELSFIRNGTPYRAFYAHLSKIFVAVMSEVSEGQVIGQTGHTGNAWNLPSHQRHLHFEIRTKHGHGKHGSIDPSMLLGASLLTCHS
jgi:murein DD-endopeptidase MepM/ murein hydrolase activator NlpD